MPSERDLRVARLTLRLQVGADGDPLDSEILEAYESLPESSIIRNDWVRRRFLLGHLLEREGISGLLASIAALGVAAPGSAVAGRAAEAGPEHAEAGAPAASAGGFVPSEAPRYDEGPARQLAHAAPAAPPQKAATAKRRMQGLMPVLPADPDRSGDGSADSKGAGSQPERGDQRAEG